MSGRNLKDGAMAEMPHGSLSEIGRDLGSRPYARRGVAARSQPVRIALVDDHALVRAGLRALLHAHPDIAIVGEGSSGPDAVVLATSLRPDVIVMDLDMPNGDGLSATRALQDVAPDVRVLIVSMYAEREKLLAALAAGARGYLAKSSAERDLVDAILVVAAGEVYLRPAIALAIGQSEDPSPSPIRLDARSRLDRLSQRERSVVALTAEGFNGPEIGRQLGITAKTVDTYKQRIEEKLGLAHRTDYVRFALQAELLGTTSR